MGLEGDSTAKLSTNFIATWCVEDVTRLKGKKTRLTMSHVEGKDEFRFTISPLKTSDERGGASFGASGGRGTFEVKCLSDVPSCRLRALTVGKGSTRCVTHDFSLDGIMCRVPDVFDFIRACDQGSLTVKFHFDSFWR